MTELIIMFVWLERIALSDWLFWSNCLRIPYFFPFEYSKPQQVYRDKLCRKELQLTPIDGKVENKRVKEMYAWHFLRA